MQQFHFSRLLSLSMVYTYVFQYLYIVINMTTLLTHILPSLCNSNGLNSLYISISSKTL